MRTKERGLVVFGEHERALSNEVVRWSRFQLLQELLLVGVVRPGRVWLVLHYIHGHDGLLPGVFPTSSPRCHCYLLQAIANGLHTIWEMTCNL